MQTKRKTRARGGFTLVELLVVIGIIIALIGLLIPVGGRVRRAAQAAAVSQQISVIGQAVDNYFHDFHAYPGPVANINIGPNPPQAGGNAVDQIPVLAPGNGNLLWGAPGKPALTMSENLVLGVIGGLKPNPIGSPNAASYDPTIIFPNINSSPQSFAPGAAPGPLGLNPSAPKKYGSYMPAQDLSDGYYHDALADQIKGGGNGLVQAIDDTIVPEFLDRFPFRMPILYLRARVGASGTSQNPTYNNNNVITYDPINNARPGQYDLSQFMAYTQSYKGGLICIGEGKTVPSKYYNASSPAPVTTVYHGLGGYQNQVTPVDVNATLTNPPPPTKEYFYPYNAYAYFLNLSLSPNNLNGNMSQDVPRQKDGYILISAGVDRMYGTSDDICSFGNLQQ